MFEKEEEKDDDDGGETHIHNSKYTHFGTRLSVYNQ